MGFRLRLAAVATILSGCAASEREPARWLKAKEEFACHKGEFEAFCKTHEVFITKPQCSPPERAIAAMSKRALPFAIEEIRNGDPTWTWVVVNLVFQHSGTVFPPTQEGMENRHSYIQHLRSKDWVRWWEENKTSPEWNVFLGDP